MVPSRPLNTGMRIFFGPRYSRMTSRTGADAGAARRAAGEDCRGAGGGWGAVRGVGDACRPRACSAPVSSFRSSVSLSLLSCCSPVSAWPAYSCLALTAVSVSPIVQPSVGRATTQSLGSLRGATRTSPVISSGCPPSSVSTTVRPRLFAAWRGDGGVRAASTLRPELSFRVSSQLSSHAHFLALFLFHTQTQTPSRCVSIPGSLPLLSGPQPCLLRHE
jgi:hypothetical protein